MSNYGHWQEHEADEEAQALKLPISIARGEAQEPMVPWCGKYKPVNKVTIDISALLLVLGIDIKQFSICRDGESLVLTELVHADV